MGMSAAICGICPIDGKMLRALRIDHRAMKLVFTRLSNVSLGTILRRSRARSLSPRYSRRWIFLRDERCQAAYTKGSVNFIKPPDLLDFEIFKHNFTIDFDTLAKITGSDDSGSTFFSMRVSSPTGLQKFHLHFLSANLKQEPYFWTTRRKALYELFRQGSRLPPHTILVWKIAIQDDSVCLPEKKADTP